MCVVAHEARLTARIRDPRVVRAVDVGVHRGAPYLAQQYLEGIDLAELYQRRRYGSVRAR